MATPIRQVTDNVSDGTQATPAWANNVLQWLRGVSRSITGKGYLMVGAGNLNPIGLAPPTSGTTAVLQASGDTVAWVDSESLAASSETIGEMLIVTGVGVMGKIAPPSGDGTYYLRTSVVQRPDTRPRFRRSSCRPDRTGRKVIPRHEVEG